MAVWLSDCGAAVRIVSIVSRFWRWLLVFPLFSLRASLLPCVSGMGVYPPITGAPGRSPHLHLIISSAAAIEALALPPLRARIVPPDWGGFNQTSLKQNKGSLVWKKTNCRIVLKQICDFCMISKATVLINP